MNIRIPSYWPASRHAELASTSINADYLSIDNKTLK